MIIHDFLLWTLQALWTLHLWLMGYKNLFEWHKGKYFVPRGLSRSISSDESTKSFIGLLFCLRCDCCGLYTFYPTQNTISEMNSPLWKTLFSVKNAFFFHSCMFQQDRCNTRLVTESFLNKVFWYLWKTLRKYWKFITLWPWGLRECCLQTGTAIFKQ